MALLFGQCLGGWTLDLHARCHPLLRGWCEHWDIVVGGVGLREEDFVELQFWPVLINRDDDALVVDGVCV